MIDIPADLFADASENVENVDKPEPVADKAVEEPAPVVVAEKDAASVVVPEEKASSPVEVTEPKGDETKVEGEITPDKVDKIAGEITPEKVDKVAGEADELDRPGLFGFRLPTIVILRRPSVFDDPFSFFPFSISSVNRRPSFGSPLSPPDNRDVVAEEEGPVVGAAASPSEQRPVSIGNNAGIAGTHLSYESLKINKHLLGIIHEISKYVIYDCIIQILCME